MLRRRRARDPIAAVDPRGLTEPWRRSVEDALAARSRFAQVVGAVRKGPLRERVEELAAKVDEGVLAAWETASRGSQAAAVLGTLDPDGVTAQLKAAKRRLESAPGDPVAQAEVDALAAQHRAVHSLWDGVNQSSDRLRLLEVRLGAAVARAATLAVTAHASTDLDAAAAELTSVVDELEALRGALDDVG